VLILATQKDAASNLGRFSVQRGVDDYESLGKLLPAVELTLTQKFRGLHQFNPSGQKSVND